MRLVRKITIAWLLAFCATLSVAACAPYSAADGTRTDEHNISIFVTSNGWHSEIVVARAQLPAGAIPEAADFPDALYLSFGWGDAEYYPAPRKSLGMTLSAALLPTPAVVHLAGLPAHPRDIFPGDEVIEVRVSAEGFRALTAYLAGSFARGGEARVQALSPGLYSFSRFYPASGKFHLFNTCNTWTARGVQQGGLPVQIFGTWSAEDLMAQLRRAVQARRDGDSDWDSVSSNAAPKAADRATAFET